MTAGDADMVLEARKVLKEWEGPPAPELLASAIRETLAPLFSDDCTISPEAREKLDEIDANLGQLAEQALTPERLDALDILMLGLWIRIELLAETPSDQ